ncbi:DNA methylase N-4 [Variovorax paradoxus]|nr:DNA methylase N-4 [Variovorax paradoxus]
MGLSAAAAEKRDSLDRRVAKVMEIIDESRRAAAALQQGVLPEEPNRAARKAEGADEAQPRSGGAEGVSQEVLRGESRAPAGSPAGTRAPELSGEAGGVPRPAAEDAAQELRADAGDVRGHAGGAGREMPDLRADDGAAGDRPRSRDGRSARAVVPPVQLGAGAVPGFAGHAAQGSGVSEQVIVWCDLNAEQLALERALQGAGISLVSLTGSQSVDDRDELLWAWRQRKVDAFVSKPEMYGAGINLQQCHRMIFAGIDYSFNAFIQAVHRIHRFGQSRRCEVHIVHTEAEREVLRTLQVKWAQHEEMAMKMTEIIRKYGLSQLAMQETLARTIGVQRVEVKGDLFAVAQNDCVEEAKLQPEDSVDLIVTSIPFANHYEYTPSFNDFGHTEDNAHFWKQMDFLTPELLRILKPGRVYACHTKDRINFGNVTGAGVPTVSPFHAEALFHGLKHGFDYLGMITVVTDVVRENNQTYRLGYTEMCKDGTKMGVGSPEYILLFHKPQTDRSRGYADQPVMKSKVEYSLARWQVDAHAFWRSSGNRMLTAEEMASYGPAKLAKLFTEHSLANVYDFEFHVRIGEELLARQALPSTFMSLAPGSHHSEVWHDVNRMLTLNGDQSRRAVEQHMCPLQFDIVDRLIERYSMKGERVYDPFCGLGTVPVRAIKLGRTGGGSELNPAYFLDQVHYLRAAERDASMPSLFDLEELAA